MFLHDFLAEDHPVVGQLGIRPEGQLCVDVVEATLGDFQPSSLLIEDDIGSDEASIGLGHICPSVEYLWIVCTKKRVNTVRYWYNKI